MKRKQSEIGPKKEYMASDDELRGFVWKWAVEDSIIIEPTRDKMTDEWTSGRVSRPITLDRARDRVSLLSYYLGDSFRVSDPWCDYFITSVGRDAYKPQLPSLMSFSDNNLMGFLKGIQLVSPERVFRAVDGKAEPGIVVPRIMFRGETAEFQVKAGIYFTSIKENTPNSRNEKLLERMTLEGEMPNPEMPIYSSDLEQGELIQMPYHYGGDFQGNERNKYQPGKVLFGIRAQRKYELK